MCILCQNLCPCILLCCLAPPASRVLELTWGPGPSRGGSRGSCTRCRPRRHRWLPCAPAVPYPSCLSAMTWTACPAPPQLRSCTATCGAERCVAQLQVVQCMAQVGRFASDQVRNCPCVEAGQAALAERARQHAAGAAYGLCEHLGLYPLICIALPYKQLNNFCCQAAQESRTGHLPHCQCARLQGDVYHLLFNLGEWLDGRIWPEQDELDVLRMLDLIHHVTAEAICLSLCPDSTAMQCLARPCGCQRCLSVWSGSM